MENLDIENNFYNCNDWIENIKDKFKYDVTKENSLFHPYPIYKTVKFIVQLLKKNEIFMDFIIESE